MIKTHILLLLLLLKRKVEKEAQCGTSRDTHSGVWNEAEGTLHWGGFPESSNKAAGTLGWS